MATTYTPTKKGKKQISGGILYSTDSDGNLALAEQVWDENKQRKVSDFGFLSTDKTIDVKEVTQDLIDKEGSPYQQTDLGLWDVTRSKESNILRHKGSISLIELLMEELNIKESPYYVEEELGNVYHINSLGVVDDEFVVEGEHQLEFNNLTPTKYKTIPGYFNTPNGKQIYGTYDPNNHQFIVLSPIPDGFGTYLLFDADATPDAVTGNIVNGWIDITHVYIHQTLNISPNEPLWDELIDVLRTNNYLQESYIYPGDNLVCTNLPNTEWKIWDGFHGVIEPIRKAEWNADDYDFNPPATNQEDDEVSGS